VDSKTSGISDTVDVLLWQTGVFVSDTVESGVSEGIVPCDTTHVKVEKTSRVSDELTATDDAGSVARHPGMVSSSDAGLPPLVSLMPSAKRARYERSFGFKQKIVTT